MNYNILVVIVVAIFGSVVLAALAEKFRHAFQVPEGYAGLLCHKGKFAKVPGFVPLKNGKVGSPEHKPEDGAS